MNRPDSDNKGMPRSNSMLDLESGGGILTDDDEFRGYGGNKRHSKRKLDRLRSGSLGNRLGLNSIESGSGDENNVKEKSSSSRVGMGKGSKKPPKPPRPPRGPALDAADMKYVREISVLSKVKHARIEHMRSLRSKRVDDKKSRSSSSSSSLGANILAMTVTVGFFVIVIFQGLRSR
ncbi:unnamed protein product [Linum tenue]|uniref:Transmembrane protein n=1 Tax=Linum tenue TaxID=586396 RepID=A0AAV0NLX2_9ROSI|nr:unnamed protein product [Linum tenue]